MTWALFIDDERLPPRDDRVWFVARCLLDVKELIELKGMPSYISFDHDLGDGPTGYDVAQMLVDMDLDGNDEFPVGFDFYVHSQNPIGKANIENLMNRYMRFKNG